MARSLFIILSVVLILGMGALTHGSGDALAQAKGTFVERTIKSSFRFYNLYAAFAIKENDLSICKGSTDYSKCIERAENIYDIENFAKGNCNEFEVGLQRDLCIGVDQGCAVENQTAEDMCNAIKRKRASEMSRVSYRPEWAFQLQPMDDTEALAMLGLYNGFKRGSLSSCTNFAKGEHRLMISGACEILFTPGFSSASFDKLIDELVEAYKTKAGLLLKGAFQR